MPYRQVQVVASGFGALRSIALDGHGHLFAAGDSEVKVFDGAGRLLRRHPTSTPALSVAVAADGSVYAGQIRRIEIFSGSGKRAWRDEQLLGRITCLGFAGDSVLAGDAADRAIRRFDRSGRFLNNIGKDNRVNGLLIPNGVVDFAVDADGIIHAANPGKHRVERYTPAGELLGHIGRFDGNDPEGFTGCCNPTNVAVAGCLYTAEKAPPRLKAYDFSGKLLAVIATDAFDPNLKNMPVAAGARGRVYVADTVKNAILVFEPV